LVILEVSWNLIGPAGDSELMEQQRQ